ncbi:type III pantothenate kinase [Cupriavidus sp. SZY C1]|uniref:type III pantothenate kinase n=1 Tax=Cupriavidus sp. SZY C1 TaxID=3055037 RepID=UPI0028B8FEAA|nr:type III pantothenate kinase [Cupriavidus sp. SZY C1]MDT6963461.1 type III pantothenate kinase [Cupriavidus sp. SZY C1]
MSLLLIDIGNTRLKWAWCDGAPAPAQPAAPGGLPTPWQHAGAASHAVPAERAALRATWQGLASRGAPAVWIANVAGPTLAGQVDALLADTFGSHVAPQWVRTAARHGDLVNGYREPTQLGVDRWVGSIGAHRWLPGQTLLVVTAGTATTLDIVTATADGGRFEGGLILPGLQLMLGTLARNTAQLPELDVLETGSGAARAVRALGADNTHDAIAAGCLAAQAGAIERTWRTLAERGPVRCLLSGGARHAVAGALAMPCEMHDNLVLLGLHAMAAPG